MRRTPSQLDGMEMEAELVSRCKGVNFITQVGIMLKVPQLTIATAAVYLQRFFMRYSMVKVSPQRPGMHPYTIAATSLFLATKVEENVRRMREFVVACCRVGQKQPNMVVDEQSREYWRWRDVILHHEDVLLEAICFDLHLEQPYRLLYDFLCFFGVSENKSLRNASWAFVNDSMYTVLCLQFTARTIGAAALYAAARHCDVGFEDDDAGRPWWEQIDVDLSMVRRACMRMVELYERNAVQRHSQHFPAIPFDEGTEKTRIQRPGDTGASISKVESDIKREFETGEKDIEKPDVSRTGAGNDEKPKQESGVNQRKRSREPEGDDSATQRGPESIKKPRIPRAAFEPAGSGHESDVNTNSRKRSREPRDEAHNSHDTSESNERHTAEPNGGDRSPKRPRAIANDNSEARTDAPPQSKETISDRRSPSRDQSRENTNRMNGHVPHDNRPSSSTSQHFPPPPPPPPPGRRPSHHSHDPHRSSHDHRDRSADGGRGGGERERVDPVQQQIDDIVQKNLPPSQAPHTHNNSDYYLHPPHSHSHRDRWPERRTSDRYWDRDRDRGRDWSSRSRSRGYDHDQDRDRDRDRGRGRGGEQNPTGHHDYDQSRERSRDRGSSLPPQHHFRNERERERGRSATPISSEIVGGGLNPATSSSAPASAPAEQEQGQEQSSTAGLKTGAGAGEDGEEEEGEVTGGGERRPSGGSEEGEVA